MMKYQKYDDAYGHAQLELWGDLAFLTLLWRTVTFDKPAKLWQGLKCL